MKRIYVLILLLLSLIILFLLFRPQKQERVCAFLRVKNEIKTIEACLNSIDGIFDKIVIIHSNEPDDGSVAFMNDWCGKRNYCEIHEYPYRVIPSHSTEYKTNSFKKENSLASYYNFGLQFFEPEDWVVKIDGDQVYLKEKLRDFVRPFQQGQMDDTKQYNLCGYNSFVRNNELVLFKQVPINGLLRDSFFIKRKYIKPFSQNIYYETTDISLPLATMSDPVWFHFMKSLKLKGVIKSNDQTTLDEIKYLSPEQKDLFEKNIRPLLKNSPYSHIDVPTDNSD